MFTNIQLCYLLHSTNIGEWSLGLCNKGLPSFTLDMVKLTYPVIGKSGQATLRADESTCSLEAGVP